MTIDDRRQSDRSGWSRSRWVLIAFIGIAAYFLAAEHKAHVTGWLASYGIWLLLLACPLLHLFMHSGHCHGGDRGHRHGEKKNKRE